jgi:hypothetical protein
MEIVLAREDAEYQLHALQTRNTSSCVNRGIAILGNWIVQKCLDHGLDLITQPVHITPLQ